MKSVCFQVFLGFLSSLLCVSRDDHVEDELTMDPVPVSSNIPIDLESTNDRAEIVRNPTQIKNTAEWRQLAAVLDRIFMFLFCVIVVVFAIAYRKI